jgi:hypothetical protein
VGLSSLAIFPALGIGGSLPSEVAIALTLLAITAFALGWVALGVSAVRIDRLGGATLHGASA